jgi:hypothetical protein
MQITVHPAQNMMRGDGDGYNPRNFSITPLADGRKLIEGVFKDDGCDIAKQPRPHRPFRVTLPVGLSDWQLVNQLIFQALQQEQGNVDIDYP